MILTALTETIKTNVDIYFESDFLQKNRPPILISGEAGTEMLEVAEYIHERLNGSKKDLIFCRTISSEEITKLLNDTLGTVILSGIQDLPAAFQDLLLERLNTTSKQVIVTGSPVGLREDLFYKLKTLEIKLPPLRSRAKDILKLTDFMIETYSKLYSKPAEKLSDQATKALLEYRWPGNTAELSAVIQRAVLSEDEAVLQLLNFRQRSHAQTHIPKENNSTVVNPQTLIPLKFVTQGFENHSGKTLSELRKQQDDLLVQSLLTESLEKHQGNVSAVARELKVDRANLLRLLKRFSISPDSYRNLSA